VNPNQQCKLLVFFVEQASFWSAMKNFSQKVKIVLYNILIMPYHAVDGLPEIASQQKDR
jgi:hypothetical protein